jgi:hypothetical protein
LPGDRIVEADGALITQFVERCGTSLRGDGIERGVRQIKHQTMERISDVSDRFLPQIVERCHARAPVRRPHQPR